MYIFNPNSPEQRLVFCRPNLIETRCNVTERNPSNCFVHMTECDHLGHTQVVATHSPVRPCVLQVPIEGEEVGALPVWVTAYVISESLIMAEDKETIVTNGCRVS